MSVFLLMTLKRENLILGLSMSNVWQVRRDVIQVRAITGRVQENLNKCGIEDKE